MNMADLIPVVLLVLLALGLSIGTGMVLLALRLVRQKALVETQVSPPPTGFPYERSSFSRRPGCWLAVRCDQVLSVQSALGLHNPTPCSWAEGLAGEKGLFIAPPVRGWILVVGSGLPDPGADVDACFRLVLGLSRKLGQVQFFNANRILNHHAWVRVESGRVVRAYAWAGQTLWHQGEQTRAERELGMECRDYCAAAEDNGFGEWDAIASNVDRVPLLAARWSLDPAGLDESFLEHERGIAGEPSRRY